tara:strand:+ start:604 stop:933 length:330 start_codon:yes stop_codon:yes gene_type:complete
MFETNLLILEILLFIILLFKIITIFVLIFENYLVKSNFMSKKYLDQLLEFCHNYFLVFSSILLIVIFNPFTEKYLVLNRHVKISIFIFAILELLSVFQTTKRIKLINFQ